MSFKVIIPARYNSTRLPGKPLLDVAGKTMIQRVYEATCLSDAEEVIVATDDQRIIDACKSFSAKYCMTAKTHLSGTDRLEEVANAFKLKPDQIIVNVQGDEPLIDPALINQVAKNLADNSWASVASLCETMETSEAVFNSNNVKVVFNKVGEASYFSRAPIPWQRQYIEQESTLQSEFSLKQLSSSNKNSTSNNNSFTYKDNGIAPKSYYRHIGIYAYRTQFLHDFVSWTPSSAELLESLEQLRALENGSRIHMALACKKVATGVDTQQDLDEVRQLFSS